MQVDEGEASAVSTPAVAADASGNAIVVWQQQGTGKQAGDGVRHWEGKRHFLSTAAVAMRSIVIDYARRKKTQKRTPPGHEEPMENVLAMFDAIREYGRYD